MSDRKVIEGDFTAMRDGITYTRQQLEDSMKGWVCQSTGLSMTFSHFEYTSKNERCIVGYLPDGSVYSAQLVNWLKGYRPFPFIMERHILAQEVREYPGITFLEFGKSGSRPTIKFLLPSGEASEMYVQHWRNGHRPDGVVGGYCETYFDRNPEAGEEPGLIYYLKISHPELPPFYKIGITSKSCTAHRWGKKDGDYTVEVLNEHSMSLYNCFRLEQDLVKTFAQYKHTPNPPLRKGGNTECFSLDILGLDTESEDYEWQQAA